MSSIASAIISQLLSEEDSEAEEFLSDFGQKWIPTLLPHDFPAHDTATVAVEWNKGMEDFGNVCYYPSKEWVPLVADYFNWLDSRFKFGSCDSNNVVQWFLTSYKAGWVYEYCREKNDRRLIALAKNYYGME